MQLLTQRKRLPRIDAYAGWTEDQLRKRCRELVRANINKDILICQLVQFGGVEKMPQVFADEVRHIVAAYCE